MTNDESKMLVETLKMLGAPFRFQYGRDMPAEIKDLGHFEDGALYVIDDTDDLVIGELRGDQLRAWSDEGARRFAAFQAAAEDDDIDGEIGEGLREELEAETAENLLINEREARAVFISACEKTGTVPNMEAWEAVMNQMAERAGLPIPYRNDWPNPPGTVRAFPPMVIFQGPTPRVTPKYRHRQSPGPTP